MRNTSENIIWVNSYDGHPDKIAPVTIYPYRNRVSLNPTYGCTLGCAYCICQEDPFYRAGGRPVTVASAQKTLALMSYLENGGYSQSIILTCKAMPPVEVLQQIGEMNLKITLFVSLADTKGIVESVPVEERIELVQSSYQAGIYTVLLLRPVHEAWTDPVLLKSIMAQTRGYLHGVVITGLRASRSLQLALEKSGVLIKSSGTDAAIPEHNAQLEAKLVASITQVLPGVPIFRKRICAVNSHYGLPCFPPSAKQYRWPKLVYGNQVPVEVHCTSTRLQWILSIDSYRR